MDHRRLATYLRPTRFNSLSGVFLAGSLLSVVPPDASERVLASARRIRAAAESVRETLIERARRAPSKVREQGAALDDGWLGLRLALESRARLGDSEGSLRAATLLQKLVPDGTAFIRLPAQSKWAASEVLLQRIDAGYAAELDALLHPDYLAFLRRAQEAYGRALGLGRDASQLPSSDALRESLSALSVAIADYALSLLSELDPEDEASVSRLRRAMGPLDAHRAYLKARRAGEAPEPELDVDAPLPVIEPPPDA
ncbi:MAG: hypothetical protein RID93_02725 [Sandaracinaceae bacterium]